MISPAHRLVLLDRDGVLNQLVIDPEQGTVDSPLVPAQVRMIPRAAEAVAALNKAGWGVAIVTNQPSASKGKTTRQNLETVHQKVIDEIAQAGGKILSSHTCYHRAEDDCPCRKPRTALLEEVFKNNPGFTRENSWMIGDGLSDIQAGQSFGLRTAFLAPHKCDICQSALQGDLRPTLWSDDLWNAALKIVHWAPNA